MDLLSTVLNAADGGAVRQVASQFGLDEGQASSAISALLPALAGGMQRNMNQEGGLESLLGALSNGNHSEYLDNPERLAEADTVNDGNGILGHLLGSKDVSRQVASHAASETGLGTDLMKKMLPVVAALAMGAMSKHGSSQGLLGQAAAAALGGGMGQGGGTGNMALDLLSGFLGGGGSQQSGQGAGGLGDIIGLVGKFLK